MLILTSGCTLFLKASSKNFGGDADADTTLDADGDPDADADDEDVDADDDPDVDVDDEPTVCEEGGGDGVVLFEFENSLESTLGRFLWLVGSGDACHRYDV